MSEVAIIFGINVLTSILKRWIEPKWGKIGVQITIFILAIIAALYLSYGKYIIGLSDIIGGAIGLFSLSVALYEVLLKHIGIFKGSEVK
jgi:hypothetical protein